MVRRYFKDLTFQIAFFHHPAGISLDDIGGIFVHKSSKESAVISARGAKRIRNPDWYQMDVSEEPLREIFQKIENDQSWGDGLLTRDMETNHPEAYAEVMRWANGYSTDRLIVLAFGDGEFSDSFNPELRPVAHRMGGVELVVEYLLSNFASAEVNNLPKRWERLDGIPLTEQEEGTLRWEDVDYMAGEGYRLAEWIYDFSTAGNFCHLDAVYSELVDDEFAVFKDHERFLHQVDQKAVAQMYRWIEIPYELWLILSEEQKTVWKDEKIPKIIREHLDFLGNDLFGMNLHSASKDVADSYMRAAAASWDAEIGVWPKHDHDD